MDKDLSTAANDLIRVIYQVPNVDWNTPVEQRQAYRNGYYSIRDLREFKRLVELLEAEGGRVEW
jgi:hypothetical protein